MAVRAPMTTSSLSVAAVRSTLFLLGALLAISSAIALRVALSAQTRREHVTMGLAVGSRRALRSVARDTSDSNGCRNARGGPHLAADSNGAFTYRKLQVARVHRLTYELKRCSRAVT